MKENIERSIATLTEIRNHILMNLKPGERLVCYKTYKGNTILSADLDLLVKRGLLAKKFYSPTTYSHVDYFRAE